jgi:hypothetical protein
MDHPLFTQVLSTIVMNSSAFQQTSLVCDRPCMRGCRTKSSVAAELPLTNI